MEFKIPVRDNQKLQALVDRINADQELFQIWKCANVNAVDRCGISDHGEIHIRFVANAALRIIRLLVKGAVELSLVLVAIAPWLVAAMVLALAVGLPVSRLAKARRHGGHACPDGPLGKPAWRVYFCTGVRRADDRDHGRSRSAPRLVNRRTLYLV